MKTAVVLTLIAVLTAGFVTTAAAQDAAQRQDSITVLIPLNRANPALIAELLGGTAIYDQPAMAGGGAFYGQVGRGGYGRGAGYSDYGYGTNRGYGTSTGRYGNQCIDRGSGYVRTPNWGRDTQSWTW